MVWAPERARRWTLGDPPPDRVGPAGSDPAADAAGLSTLQLLRALDTTPGGLTEAEAGERQVRTGRPVDPDRPPHPALRLLSALGEPFTALLSVAALFALVAGYLSTGCVAALLAGVAAGLRLREEARAGRSRRALRALTAETATVRRRPEPGGEPLVREVPPGDLVPGDIVLLGPGDPVPADVRLLRAAGLTVDQGALTGEGEPTAKRPADEAECPGPAVAAGFAAPHLCFAGSRVASGTATAVVLATGPETRYGQAHHRHPADRTAVRNGYRFRVRRVLRALVLLAAAVLPLVLLAAAVRGHALEALPLGVALAVGLVPEMLPVVVTAVQARSATAATRQGVMVEQLATVHDLGAMDVLCLDKTGTLTDGVTAVDAVLDPLGRPATAPLRWAALTSRVQCELGEPGAVDAVDEALLAAEEAWADSPEEPEGWAEPEWFEGVAASGFDPVDRRSTVLVRDPGRPGRTLRVTKGAPEAVLADCVLLRTAEGDLPIDAGQRARLDQLTAFQAGRGLRLLAVAAADSSGAGLTLLGFVGLRDRTAASAVGAVAELTAAGVRLVVLTGDHPAAAQRICRELGLPPGRAVLGAEVDALAPQALAELAARTTVFARLTPAHKARVVRALGDSGATVGFLGDGLNDAPALRAAEVGICTERAVGAARAAAGVQLAGPDLRSIVRGILAGRDATVRAGSYLRIVLSGNVGNTLSMVLGSMFLPFLPMLPGQVLLQNLCFDAVQLTLAFDRTPGSPRPRNLEPAALIRFVAAFGVLNSLADLATFVLMRLLAGPDAGPHAQVLFHSGWFAENLLTQAVALYLLRAGAGSGRPSRPVGAAVAVLAALGLLLPASPLAHALGLAPLPALGYPALAAVVAAFAAATTALRRRWPLDRTGRPASGR